MTVAASGPRALAVCFASGVALSLAFPEPSISLLSWVAIAPLLVMCVGVDPRVGFGRAFTFGAGFFSVLLLWISAVGWIAWALLVVMEAALFGVFGLAWALASRTPRIWWIVLAPALWVAVELLREDVPIVGFPWGQLAQGQVGIPWELPLAGIGGGKTVSFLVVAVNMLVALAWLARGARRVGFAVIGAGLLGLGPLVGAMGPHADTSTKPLRIAIVQGNAGSGVRVEDERARVERHLALTKDVAADNPDLVVWPESSVGIDPTRDSDIATMIAEAARAVDAPMVVGANLEAGNTDRYMVMTLLVSADGEIVDRYQKTHLVPFGEYIPARGLLGGLPMLQQVPRDAVAGRDPRNFDVDGTPVATVISFEGDFGPLVRDRIELGARLLVVATNTSTWGRSWASAQHVAMSQVRAAENGVPVVHAALSGISAAISEDGRVLADTPLYVGAALVFEMRPSSLVTLYANTGEWFPLSCVALAIGGTAVGSRRRSVGTVA